MNTIHTPEKIRISTAKAIILSEYSRQKPLEKSIDSSIILFASILYYSAVVRVGHLNYWRAVDITLNVNKHFIYWTVERKL